MVRIFQISTQAVDDLVKYIIFLRFFLIASDMAINFIRLRANDKKFPSIHFRAKIWFMSNVQKQSFGDFEDNYEQYEFVSCFMLLLLQQFVIFSMRVFEFMRTKFRFVRFSHESEILFYCCRILKHSSMRPSKHSGDDYNYIYKH